MLHCLLFVFVIFQAVLGCSIEAGFEDTGQSFKGQILQVVIRDSSCLDVNPYTKWAEADGAIEYQCLHGALYAAWHFDMRVELLPGIDEEIVEEKHTPWAHNTGADSINYCERSKEKMSDPWPGETKR